MAQKSKFKLPPLNIDKKSLGQRIARLRNEKGYTQAKLAEQIGIGQKIISDYELNKIRPHFEMVIRLALALDVITDELLGLKKIKGNGRRPNKKILRRLEKIDALPLSQQKFILRAIDSHLKALKS